MQNKLVIVCGSSGSGKTTIANSIFKKFAKQQAQIICLDQFYLDKHDDKLPLSTSGKPNFDHPNAFDWKLLIKVLSNLLTNKPAEIPVYDYTKSERCKKWTTLKPTKLIILEGILTLYNKEINDLSSLKLFVNTELDECFIRRLQRDVNERKRTFDSVVDQWRSTVKPMYKKYLQHQEQDADIIIPWYKVNETGLKAIYASLQSILTQGEKHEK